MADTFERFGDWLGLPVPPYEIAAIIVLLLYAVQSEIRFGAKARKMIGNASDRGSTIALSLASIVPVVGLVWVVQATVADPKITRPLWFLKYFLWPAQLPEISIVAWTGVWLGMIGLVIRLWSVLTLRNRYTRTLFVQEGHTVEQRGPYRFVRHPGYLGSLLCLNGIALASCSAIVWAASIVATLLAYAYRIRVEDKMLVDAFGQEYEAYRRRVGALIPFARPS